MRIKLGRKQTITIIGFTGLASCGCRFFYGDRLIPCAEHAEQKAGKHRKREDADEAQP